MRIRNTNTGQEFEVLPGTRIPDFYEIVADEAQKPVKTIKKPVLAEKEPEPKPEIPEKCAKKPEKNPEKCAKKKKSSRKKKGAKNAK